jgi:DNA repair exonuclease SbcCD ATPase subunit
MIVKSLKVCNFLPFKGEQTISFPASGVISVLGQYEEENTRSNRSGKSALLEAIRYCLYGESRARREVDLIHDGETEMFVECEFDFNGTIVTIKRGRDSKNKSLLELKGTTGYKKDIQGEIVRLVGMDYDDFVSTCFFKQEDIHGFMTLPSSEKKKLLRRWLGMDYWSVYEDSSKKKVDETQTAIAKLDMERGSIIPQVQTPTGEARLEDMDKEVSKLATSFQESQGRESTIIEGIHSLETQQKAYDELPRITSEINRIQKDVSTVENTISNFQSQIPVATSEQARLKDLVAVPSQLQEIDDKLSGLSKDIRDVEKRRGAAIGSLKEKQQLLQALECFSGKCPIDEGECPRDMKQAAGGVSKVCEGMKSALDQLTLDLDTRNLSSSTLNDNKKTLKELDQERNTLLTKASPDAIQRLIDGANGTLRSYKATLDAYSERRDQIKISVGDPDHLISELAQKKNLKEKEKTFQQMCNDRTFTLKEEIGKIKERVEKRQDAITRLKTLEPELGSLRRDLFHYQFITGMFGKDGIPSIQTENSFKEIEGDTNLVLKELACGLNVEFSSLRDTQQWEESCFVCGTAYPSGEKICNVCKLGYKRKKQKDELNIRLFEGSKDRDFSMDSGGGRTLVSVAIRIALSRLLQRRLKAHCRCLFLDEVFGSLDRANRTYLLSIISRVLPMLGFEQIFVITHTDIVGEGEVVMVTRHKDHFSTVHKVTG